MVSRYVRDGIFYFDGRTTDEFVEFIKEQVSSGINPDDKSYMDNQVATLNSKLQTLQTALTNEVNRAKTVEDNIATVSADLMESMNISSTETKTSRTYNGKPTYTKSIAFTLVAGDTSQTTIDLGVAIDSVIAVRGFVREDNGTTHGIINSNLSISGQAFSDTTQLNAWFATNVTTSYIIYSDGFGGMSGEAVFEYTKV